MWLLVIFTVLAIVAMATLTFSRTEFIQGRLSPQSAEARMFAEVPGIVQSVNVKLGDIVNAGDVLVQVSTEQTSDGVRIGTASLDGLRRERGMIGPHRVVQVDC